MQIVDVRIETAHPGEVLRFYAETLGQPVDRHPDGFTATVGATRLTVATAAVGETPTYHLAFTIPRNLLPSAKRWLAERTPLLTDAAGKEEFHFDSWEATSIYFADPAGNILELIAWDALANEATGPFGPEHLRCVSEVGIPTTDVPATVARLGAAGLAPYRDDWSPDFAPIGDPTGRLIVVPVGRPWFPVGWPAASAPLALTLRGDTPTTISLPGTETTITVAPTHRSRPPW